MYVCLPESNFSLTMKSPGSVIAWGIKRIKDSIRNIISSIICIMTSIKPKRVIMWAFDFKQYGCNPRALTEYLLENHPEFEIYWAFRHNVDISGIDKRVKCVRYRSIEFQKIINTAEFIVTNCRTDPYNVYWHKRDGQKYIMQWHGGVSLKKIEKDAEEKLNFMYLDRAHRDSKVCDLMISGCRFHTDLIRNAFWYDGEILEKGIPRNDIFFKDMRHGDIKKEVCRKYGLNDNTRIVLYAPTFRKPVTIEPYRIDWNRMIPEFQRFLDTEDVTIMLRLHPNFIGKTDVSSLLNHRSVIDVTRYHDMQELLCISDILITDYSSSMFDYSMMKRPCFIYATDIEKYERGYYFDFHELPYDIARSQEELIYAVRSFSPDRYGARLKDFMDNKVGLFENGHACKEQAIWMLKHLI